MLLKINGDAVDFTLEKEAVLSDVVSGVETWLAGAGYMVTGISLGTQDLLASPREKWAAVPISSVAELDFSASRAEDLRVEHWAASRAWLDALAKAVEARSTDALRELTAALPPTLNGLKKNPFLPAGSDALERLSALFQGQTPEAVSAWTAERIGSALGTIGGVRDALAARIREALHPEEALGECLAALKVSVGGVTEISLLLQTGKDAQAMDRIVRFTETVQRLLGIMPFLPKDAGRDALFREINPFLKQLVEAFDSKDLVLIGDLFEYELAPRLERLIPALEKTI